MKKLPDDMIDIILILVLMTVACVVIASTPLKVITGIVGTLGIIYKLSVIIKNNK